MFLSPRKQNQGAMSYRPRKLPAVQKQLVQHEEIATYMMGSWQKVHNQTAVTWHQDATIAPSATNAPLANFKPFDLNKLM